MKDWFPLHEPIPGANLTILRYTHRTDCQTSCFVHAQCGHCGHKYEISIDRIKRRIAQDIYYCRSCTRTRYKGKASSQITKERQSRAMLAKAREELPDYGCFPPKWAPPEHALNLPRGWMPR